MFAVQIKKRKKKRKGLQEKYSFVYKEEKKTECGLHIYKPSHTYNHDCSTD